MQRSIFPFTYPTAAIAICVIAIGVATSANLQAKDIQVGHYSLFSATPTEVQADLLATTMTVRFPGRIQSVGEAVRYLLQRSGYRLAAAEFIAPDTLALSALSLPAVHRSLGPMTLRDALETLAGSAFHLVQDPVHRLVSFGRCTSDQFSAHEAATTIEREVAQDEN